MRVDALDARARTGTDWPTNEWDARDGARSRTARGELGNGGSGQLFDSSLRAGGARCSWHSGVCVKSTSSSRAIVRRTGPTSSGISYIRNVTTIGNANSGAASAAVIIADSGLRALREAHDASPDARQQGRWNSA